MDEARLRLGFNSIDHSHKRKLDAFLSTESEDEESECAESEVEESECAESEDEKSSAESEDDEMA